MEWIVEFEGRQLPLDAVWNDELARIVSPLKSTIEKALGDAARPDDLAGLRIIVYAEDDSDGPVWGFRFAGPPSAVSYAVSLVGTERPVTRPGH